MKRKSILIFPVLLLAASLVFASGCKREPGFCGRNLPDRILKMADRSVRDLALTPEQKKKYDEMKAETRANIEKYLEERKKVSGQISAELAKENPDMNKIALIMKENPPIREEAYRQAIDGLMKFYAILDDRQKGKVIEKIRKMQKNFGCEGR
ncbi:MAG TPA: Spy/CpxP family protein refolding chaperone [Spirochaetota bacterium]|nr:Spy/CpxP family protein refolding chaperone [Spirochaetota bacterium]HSA14423.1 Spy/CpxP family protein refolding chaperone [Spirochaetota bacterium]